MPVIKVSSGDAVANSVRYVALGDSIAFGYGLTDPERDSYVGQVQQYLEQNYDSVFAANLGTNGQESGELLDILTNPKNEKYKKYQATLKYADVVTISIGSNDLLHLVRLDRDVKEYIEQGDAMFSDACQEFQSNFPKIIKAIHQISPSARIYANNIYNPCHSLKQYESLYDLAERYIDMLNKTFTEEKGFILVNIKEEFDRSDEDLLNVTLNGREIDPHPSKVGHKKIGDIVIQAIKGGLE